jgi:electron transport complex protein RnfG
MLRVLGQSISRNALLLGLFALVTTALIAATYLATRDRIAAEERKAEEKALLEIMPRDTHDNSMLDDTLPVDSGSGLGLRQQKQVYLARRAGEVIAALIPVTARDGYSGDINLVVGVRRNGEVAGVRVLSHRETPGLGDNVDLAKSDWLLGFDGRSIGDPPLSRWAVKKDRGAFDQFTGATITPRAVVAATLRALQYAAEHEETLFPGAGPSEREGGP